MKKLIAFLLSFSVFVAKAQQTYLPSTDGVSVGRPIGATNFPTDARTYFRDRTNFTYRPYVNTTEVLTTLNTAAHRKGHFPIIVNTGGTLASGVITGGTNATYWFKDGVTNGDLVVMNTGADTTSLSTRIDNGKFAVKVSEYGAGTAVTDNRAAVQNAINAVANYGGQVIFDKPGTYEFTPTTSGGITRCLTMAANVSLLIPPGVTLKLKNSTMVNGAPVQVIHIPNTATNVFIGWDKGMGGTIDGNTLNQAGWTAGYGQTTGGYLIGAQSGFIGVTIANLNLIRSFSNSINLGGGGSYGLSNRVILRNLNAQEFGEGIQIISADDVKVENVTHVMNGAIVQGDALELAFCRYFNVIGCVTRTTTGLNIAQGGSGIDLYASRYGNVTGFSILGTVYGMQVETDFANSANNPDQINISCGTIRQTNFASFIFTGGRVRVSNVYALDNVFTGAQLGKASVASAEFIFNNVDFSGACQMISTTDNVVIKGNNISFSGNGVGLPLSAFSLGNTTVDFDGVYATGTSSNAFIFLAENAVPHGKILNANADGMDPIRAGGEFAMHPTDLFIEGNPPFQTTNGAVSQIVGRQIAYTSETINTATLPLGTRDQIVKILGIYGVTLQAGPKLKLLKGSSITLTNPDDFVLLQFNKADSIWRQIGGFIPELELQFLAAAPYYVQKNIGTNNLLDGDYYFRTGMRIPVLELSTRPPITGTLIKGEINGISWYGDTDPSGHLRLSAGGTSAKSWIDITGLNGDPDFTRNITFGTDGTERVRIGHVDSYWNIPLFLQYSLPTNDSSKKSASTEYVKKLIAESVNNVYFEIGHFWGPGTALNPVKLKASGVTAGTYAAANVTTDSLGRVTSAVAGMIAGSYSNAVTTTTTFTVTIGVTMGNNTYKINVTPTAVLTAASFYVTNKTTTTFDVVYLSALTGTATFDWTVIRQ